MLTTLLAGSGYALAAVTYLAFVMGERERLGAAARLALVGAAALHAVDVAAHCIRGAHPASSAREAVAFAAFVIVASFLALSWRSRRLAAVGGLVAPVALMLLIVARVTPLAARPQGIGTLGRVHIILAVLGVALFAVAALASALYLAQARQLKRKTFGTLFHRGPPLELLDRVVQRCVSLGFPVFTVAIVLGALWMARLGGTIASMPQYLLALVTWLAFAGLLLSRAVAGWHGRRSAVLAILGFAASLAVLGLYLLRSALRA